MTKIETTETWLMEDTNTSNQNTSQQDLITSLKTQRTLLWKLAKLVGEKYIFQYDLKRQMLIMLLRDNTYTILIQAPIEILRKDALFITSQQGKTLYKIKDYNTTTQIFTIIEQSTNNERFIPKGTNIYIPLMN